MAKPPQTAPGGLALWGNGLATYASSSHLESMSILHPIRNLSRTFGRVSSIASGRGGLRESKMHADTLERPKANTRKSAKSNRQRRRYDLKELVSKITEKNRHDEVQVGPAVGHEFGG